MIKGLKNLFLILALSLGFGALPLFYPTHATAQDDNDPLEYILRVNLIPGWLITDAIFAYEKDGKYYLPILSLSEGFEFFAEREDGTLYVTGFSATEEDSYVIDGDRNELIIRGVKEDLPDDAILQSEFIATDDIYVKLEVLSKVWPVSMRMDLSNLAVLAETEAELPFMRRKDREARIGMFQARQALRSQKSDLPFVENPYQLIGKPVIDYQSIMSFDDNTKELEIDNIISGRQQLGGFIADYNANLTYAQDKLQKPESIRFKLTRRSAGDEYIVPGVRNIELGDVSLRQRQLISNSQGGRGFLVSNDNRDKDYEFDRITIRETGPPGWEIELYNNDELVDFGVVPDDGEFTFDDVVLNFGNNQIKMLFFGPQGQVREKTQSYTAGGNMLKPNQFRYSLGVVDTDRPFILLENDPRNDPRGVTQTAEAGFGFTRWLTGFANFTRTPFTDKEHKYATVGVATSTPIGLVETEYYQELGGGNATDVRFLSSLLGYRLNLRASTYSDFESLDTGFDLNAKSSELEAQINKNLKIMGLPLGLRVRALQTARESGTTTTSINFAQSLTRSGVRISHNTDTRLIDELHTTTNGSLSATVREGPWQIRGGLNYTLYPEEDLSSFNSQVRYKTKDDFTVSLSTGHSFQTDVSTAGLQLGYDFDYFLGSVEGRYEEERGWDFTLRATTSLHPYTDDGSYTISSRSRKKEAPIRALVFLDTNLDGIFDPEQDTPISEAKIKTNNVRSKVSTDENGYVITGAPHNVLTNIQVDEASLGDPYYLPLKEGISTIPLNGNIIDIQIPIIETGGFEGTVFRRSNNRAVTGMTLQLIDENGDVAAETETAFDGYFTFEFIRPGTYTVRPLEKYGVKLESDTVTITPEELFIYGHDLYVNDGPMQLVPEDETAFNENEAIESEGESQYGPFQENNAG